MNWKVLPAYCLLAGAFLWLNGSAKAGFAKNRPVSAAQMTKSSDDFTWVRYTDSAEGAFSMDIPVGWQIQGGMYRFGYFDVRWMMDVRSLDGKTIFRIDDIDVPPYTFPGPNTGREGQPYFRPQQFQMMVSNYRDAQSYAELYARRRFSSVCRTMNPRTVDWQPKMPSAWQLTAGTKSSEGGVSYDCDTSDGPRIAAVYARTYVVAGSNLWVVDPIISLITTPTRALTAHDMIQYMMESWQKNPQWEQYQNQVTQMGLEKVRQGFAQFMQQMQAYHEARTAAMNQQVAGFEAHQNAQARQVSSWGETLSGLQTVSDPVTGNRFQIFSGPKANYYTNGAGVTINSNISPGPDFHQVTPVQP